MVLIESGQNITNQVGQHIIDNSFINFDPTVLSSSTCGGLLPPGLTGKYVLAEECTRFVFEHCVGKLRFFMILSAILLLCLTILMYRHKYFVEYIKFFKKKFKKSSGE